MVLPPIKWLKKIAIALAVIGALAVPVVYPEETKAIATAIATTIRTLSALSVTAIPIEIAGAAGLVVLAAIWGYGGGHSVRPLPGPASQCANARHPPLLRRGGARRTWRASASPSSPWPGTECLEMKPVGERSAGISHAAFDERGGETGPYMEPAPLLHSTLAEWACNGTAT